MKVLLVSNMYPSLDKPYSGIFVRNQFEHLKKSIDISIHFLESTDTNLIRSVLKYLYFFLKFIPHLFKRYDLIHVHFFGHHTILSIIYVFFYPKTKIIVTFHGSDSNNISNSFFKWMIKKIDYFLAVGLEQADYLLDKTEIVEINVKPAGIDKDVFYNVNSKKEYDFIFVGNFFAQKGIDIIIDVIKTDKDNTMTYCFVGSGPFEENLKMLNNSNVTIFKNKNQNELRVLLNKSKFLLLPSRGDSFGLVVTEAIYCGTPVIVSNIGGMKDQVKDNINGFILKENNAMSLEGVMKTALSLSQIDYSIMSNNALRSNMEYSLECVCLDLKNYYNSILITSA